MLLESLVMSLLHVLHITMTSTTSTTTTNSSPASSSNNPRAVSSNRKATMLRIPGPLSPGPDNNETGSKLRADEASKIRAESFGEGAELVHRGDALCEDLAAAVPGPGRDSESKAAVSRDVFGVSTDSCQRNITVVGNGSSVVGTGGVLSGDVLQEEPGSPAPRSTGDIPHAQTVHGSQETEIVSVLKRRDSPSRRTSSGSSYSRTVSVSEPVENTSDSSILRADSKTSSISSAFSDSVDDSTATTTPQISAVPKRRISFPADSVLTAVIQDGDTAELLRILTGRHGPGLVQRRGEGGVMRGVDVCQSNHVGLTALHHAVLANNLDAAKLLLCHGAEVNAQDVHGFSPLHTAAACGFLPLTSLLLLFGADVFAQTLEQELPIDVAKELRIVRLLTEEMTRLLHQELWLASLIRMRADEAWLLLRKLLACVLLFVLQLCVFIRTSWRKRHRKAE
ncbi:hypothetical protein ACOMHN_042604 [Nucella lapillus]